MWSKRRRAFVPSRLNAGLIFIFAFCMGVKTLLNGFFDCVVKWFALFFSGVSIYLR